MLLRVSATVVGVILPLIAYLAVSILFVVDSLRCVRVSARRPAAMIVSAGG